MLVLENSLAYLLAREAPGAASISGTVTLAGGGDAAGDVHAPGGSQLPDPAADMAGTDDPEHLAPEQVAAQLALGPQPVTHERVGPDDPAGHGQHEAESELGDGVG